MSGPARLPVFNVRKDYSVTPINTGAYVQLSTSLGQNIKELEIFNSCGSIMQLAIGPAGSESVLPFMILPGGNGIIKCLLNAGMRLAVIAVDANSGAVGNLVINGYA